MGHRGRAEKQDSGPRTQEKDGKEGAARRRGHPSTRRCRAQDMEDRGRMTEDRYQMTEDSPPLDGGIQDSRFKIQDSAPHGAAAVPPSCWLLN